MASEQSSVQRKRECAVLSNDDVASVTRIRGVGRAQMASTVSAAAYLVASSLLADGVVQTFGSGHSEALAMEIAGRAGGLVPTNRIALRDVVVFSGESPKILSSGTL